MMSGRGATPLSILALFSLAVASPASAWFPHGVAASGNGNSPIVTPGEALVTATTGLLATTSNINNIIPTFHGSAVEYVYGVRGFGRWDDIPQIEVGVQGVATTRHIGLFFAHPGTASDMAAGNASNIDHVLVRIDGGSWFTIAEPTINPDAGGQIDWNFQVRSQDFSDGLHQVDAIGVPSTGPDIVMQGPPSDSNGYYIGRVPAMMVSDGTGLAAGNVLTLFTPPLDWNSAGSGNVVVTDGWSISSVAAAPNLFVNATHADNPMFTGTGGAGTYGTRGPSNLATGAQFTGSISGSILTVSAVSAGYVHYGQYIVGSGVTTGMQIIDDHIAGNNACGGPCTGSGGGGTYALSASQTLSSRVMASSTPGNLGNEGSFYFITNYNGALDGVNGRGKYVLYASNSGSDSNSGEDAAHPFATVGKALGAINTENAAAGAQTGRWGGTICLMNGGSWSYSHFSGVPWGTLGWVTVQGADHAPCVNPGDIGGPTLTVTTADRSYTNSHNMWRYLNLIGHPNNASGADAWYYAVDHVTSKSSMISTGALVGNGGLACVESTNYYGQGGGCDGAVLIRGNTFKYFTDDGIHGGDVVVGNTLDGGGPSYGWATGDTTSGSTTVSNVTVPSDASLTTAFTGVQWFDVFQPGSVQVSCAANAGADLASISGTTLTVSSVGGSPGNLRVGLQVFSQDDNNPMAGTTVLVADSTHNATMCTPTCTGTGGMGTYAVSLSQTWGTHGVSGLNTVASVNEAAHTLTMGATAIATCTAGNLGNPGSHSDNWQVQVNVFADDLFFTGNSYGQNYPGFSQGLFLEQAGISGLYYANNYFKHLPSTRDAESDILIAGQDDLLMLRGNTWVQANAIRFPNYWGSEGQTFVWDTCGNSPGAAYNGVGINIRRQAAASNACYTTVP